MLLSPRAHRLCDSIITSSLATCDAKAYPMRRARPVVRERLTNQFQAALAGALKRAGRSLSHDGVELRPGRFFYVKDSCERMEFGSDREGDLGSDRPALLMKLWRDDFCFATPASLREPYPGLEKLSFKVEPGDWAYWTEPGDARDKYLFYWYERLLNDWLYDHKGDLRQERLEELKTWLQRHHTGSDFRSAELAGDWGTLQ